MKVIVLSIIQWYKIIIIIIIMMIINNSGKGDRVRQWGYVF
jgi:hypothetical protein